MNDTAVGRDAICQFCGATHLARGNPSDEAERFEEFEPGSASHTSYDVCNILEQRRTQYQELMLFESPRLGRVLALDGIVQMTDLDTYVYHEMLAHPALFSHPAPLSVAVVGGGDATSSPRCSSTRASSASTSSSSTRRSCTSHASTTWSHAPR